MIFLGCDPDLHTVGFAAVNEHGKAVFLGCCKSVGLKSGEAVCMLAEIQRTWIRDFVDRLGGVHAIAVEAQEIYEKGKGKTKNPMSMIYLAAAAGTSLQVLHGCWPTASMHFPLPKEWKKQVPKVIHQARTYRKAGWDATRSKNKALSNQYAWPQIPRVERDIIGLETVENSGDWKHVGDALGLAYWAKEKVEKHAIKVKRLNKLRAGSRPSLFGKAMDPTDA